MKHLYFKTMKELTEMYKAVNPGCKAKILKCSKAAAVKMILKAKGIEKPVKCIKPIVSLTRQERRVLRKYRAVLHMVPSVRAKKIKKVQIIEKRYNILFSQKEQAILNYKGK